MDAGAAKCDEAERKWGSDAILQETWRYRVANAGEFCLYRRIFYNPVPFFNLIFLPFASDTLSTIIYTSLDTICCLFKIPLIEIIGKKIHITDFGKEIAHSAKGILDQVYAINYKTMAYKDQLVGRLTISIVSTGKYVLPYLLTSFLKKIQV
jgi:hypothetical protein